MHKSGGDIFAALGFCLLSFPPSPFSSFSGGRPGFSSLSSACVCAGLRTSSSSSRPVALSVFFSLLSSLSLSLSLSLPGPVPFSLPVFFLLSFFFSLSLYIYIYLYISAVKSVIRPSLAIFKVNNWAKSKSITGPRSFSHYKNRGFRRFF